MVQGLKLHVPAASPPAPPLYGYSPLSMSNPQQHHAYPAGCCTHTAPRHGLSYQRPYSL